MQLRKRERHELESYDEYARVVVSLDDRTRIIECRDGVQWIVQHRSSAWRWDGVSFCQTKEALLRCAGSSLEPMLSSMRCPTDFQSQ